MRAMTTIAPRGRMLTVADLDAMPDDGNRHELVDGSLIVTPGPSIAHQLVLGELFIVIRAACPPGFHVVFAPFDVRLSRTTNLQPDLLVAPVPDFTRANLPLAPTLAIEVLSPSTRHIDLGLKRSAYEEAGTPSYWVVDPAVPSITAWELRGGTYVEAGRAQGGETLVLSRPFPVRVTPSGLVT